MKRHSRTGFVVLAVAILFGAAACGSDGEPADGAQSSPSVTQVAAPAESSVKVDSVVAASVHEPIQLIARPGDESHLWLAERAGRVRRLTVGDDANTLGTSEDYVLDVSSETTTEAERGLLGMAFAPDGEELYLSLTDTAGDTQVVRYAMSGSKVVKSSRSVVFSQPQPFSNHNGGHVVFGPDGALWLGLGDGGSADDPDNRAQNPDTYLGKMVRIDPESGDAEVVISGVRNPWRFSFDEDGSLWIGDVGQNNIEEVNRLAADDIDGANLGWSGYEGSEPYLDGEGRRPADPVPPVFEYTHEGGNCSITGGFVYRGQAMPALRGAYLFADYCAGAVRAIRLDDDGKLTEELDLAIAVERPISFASDATGEPYVLSQEGTIVRLLPG